MAKKSKVVRPSRGKQVGIKKGNKIKWPYRIDMLNADNKKVFIGYASTAKLAGERMKQIRAILPSSWRMKLSRRDLATGTVTQIIYMSGMLPSDIFHVRKEIQLIDIGAQRRARHAREKAKAEGKTPDWRAKRKASPYSDKSRYCDLG